MEEEIMIGSRVRYRGNFGSGPSEITKVKGIEVCEEGDKYGIPVDSIPFTEKDSCVFDLEDGHWCYGDQIDKIIK